MARREKQTSEWTFAAVVLLWLCYAIGFVGGSSVVYHMWGDTVEPKHFYFWVTMTSVAVIYIAVSLALYSGFPFTAVARAARQRRLKVERRAVELIERGYPTQVARAQAERELVAAASETTATLRSEGIES